MKILSSEFTDSLSNLLVYNCKDEYHNFLEVHDNFKAPLLSALWNNLKELENAIAWCRYNSATNHIFYDIMCLRLIILKQL